LLLAMDWRNESRPCCRQGIHRVALQGWGCIWHLRLGRSPDPANQIAAVPCRARPIYPRAAHGGAQGPSAYHLLKSGKPLQCFTICGRIVQVGGVLGFFYSRVCSRWGMRHFFFNCYIDNGRVRCKETVPASARSSRICGLFLWCSATGTQHAERHSCHLPGHDEKKNCSRFQRRQTAQTWRAGW
jgi:hypothetical protein